MNSQNNDFPYYIYKGGICKTLDNLYDSYKAEQENSFGIKINKTFGEFCDNFKNSVILKDVPNHIL